MSGPRQPIELVVAKGAKHLTKAEIDSRRKSEIAPLDGDLTPPSYLSKKQTQEFVKIADQLKRLKIMGETDVDALARYVVANSLYIETVKKLRRKEVKDNPFIFEKWLKMQDKVFRQARVAASDLGLTISSRCRLIVPEVNKPPEKTNKFQKFQKRTAASE